MTFEELGLRKPILEALQAQGYETPTPIQAQSISPIMEGKDIIGLAQTGTGKTAAFLLPLLDYLSGDSRPRKEHEARILILSPTRELAKQIHDNARDYSAKLAIRSTCVVGGVSIRPQIKKMANGVDLLVATPGRLEDLVKQCAVNLSTVEAIVLDEADQMLDIGFFPAIKRILGKCKNVKQRLLFSATMPREIKQLTKQYLSNPVEVAVTPVAKTADKIDQKVMHLSNGIKVSAAIHILSDMPNKRVIMFTRTKRGADRVVKRLRHENIEAAAIHGNKSQNQREKALAAFKNGDVMILIATDIAARGIDVQGIELVINYDLPQVPEAYVHRIGRTARAGASGLAITLCGAEEREMLKRIERLIKLDIPVMDTPRNLEPPQPMPKRPTGAQNSRQPNKPRSSSRRPKKSISQLAKEAELESNNVQNETSGKNAAGKKPKGKQPTNRYSPDSRPSGNVENPTRPNGKKASNKKKAKPRSGKPRHGPSAAPSKPSGNKGRGPFKRGKKRR